MTSKSANKIEREDGFLPYETPFEQRFTPISPRYLVPAFWPATYLTIAVGTWSAAYNDSGRSYYFILSSRGQRLRCMEITDLSDIVGVIQLILITQREASRTYRSRLQV